MPDGELVELEHVHDSNLRDDAAEQLRALVTTRAHQEASVRTTIDRYPENKLRMLKISWRIRYFLQRDGRSK